ARRGAEPPSRGTGPTGFRPRTGRSPTSTTARGSRPRHHCLGPDRFGRRSLQRARPAPSDDRAARVGVTERNEVMRCSFENKVALVTGAASGMGLATAKAFAEAGAAVALADVNGDGARAAADALVAAGHKAIGIRCDVADL